MQTNPITRFDFRRSAIYWFILPFLIFLPFTAFADGQPWRQERETKQVQIKPDSTGGLNYEVPITVPPGRGSMTPDVKLIYNSQSSDNLSPFGYGWSLNTPYIERINRLGTDQLYGRYDFYSTLDGELWGATTTPGNETLGGGMMSLMSGGGGEESLMDGLVSTTSIANLLEGKTLQEKATIKGEEIAKLGSVSKTIRSNYDIELVLIEPIEGGVQVFARVWRKDGTQIGFGLDGTVDMERFRIFNPPILVPDAEGDILQTWTEKDGTERSRRLREDIKEALFQVIEQDISVMKNIHGPGNIVAGKVGRTTSTFYPVAGANSPIDGYTALNYNYGSGSETNFNTIVSRDDATYTSVTGTTGNFAGFYGGQNNWGDVYRGFFLFDTSIINTDTVTSATLSLYGSGKNDESPTASPDINVYSSNPASTDNLVNGDHDQVGTTTMSSAISYSSWSTSGYNDFSLNSTGIANINKTGVSKFGTVNDNYDTANRVNTSASDPTYGANKRHNIQGYFADQTGTTQDPKLVVETASSTVTTTNYAPRIDNGDFRKYVYDNNAWVVTDKQGVTYKFGTATTSRLDSASSTSEIYRWLLDEVRDTHGNYIKYTYYKDSNQIYPSQISYTGNGVTDGVFTVNFVRESRLDIATSSKTKFDVVSKYRINEINTAVNGNWVRKYALSYATSSNTRRSLLSAVTESGQQEDQSASATLPAITFAYTASTSGWTSNIQSANKWDMSTNIILDRNDRGRLDDLNGDGYPDLYVRKSGGGASVNLAYLNNGQTWATGDNSSYHIPDDVLVTNGVTDNGVRAVDVNGDGFVDFVKGNNGSRSVWLNNASTSGWTASSTWTPTVDFVDGSNNDTKVRLLDVNGDGLPDFIQSSALVSAIWFNDGSGWGATSTSWSIPVTFGTGARFIDLNGDGLVDICDNGTAYINTGLGWTRSAGWDLPVAILDGSSFDNGVRFADINGDGLIDFTQSYTTDGAALVSTAYINKGYGWQQDAGWATSIAMVDKITTPSSYYVDKGARLLDIDGDNMPDIQQSYQNGANPGENGTYLNKSKKIDLLATVTTSRGGTLKFTHSTDLIGKSSSSHANFPFVLDTVAMSVQNDGNGVVATTSFAYDTGRYYFRNPLDRRMAGFKTISATTTLPSGYGWYKKTFYHQGDTTDTANGEYSDDISKIGKPFRVEIQNDSQVAVDTTINKWDKADLSNNRNFVKLVQTTSVRSGGDSTHRDKAESYTYDDATGNVTYKTEWGEVTASTTAGSFTDIGSDKATTTISYAASSTGYLYLPATESTVDQNGTKVRETRHYYDSLSLNSASKGDETKTEYWKSGSSYASTTKTYSSTYGFPTAQTDGNSNSTTFVYDTYNLFVATSTNPLSQTTGYTYDYSSGQVKQTLDPNNRAYITYYDPLDRVSTTTEPDPSTGSSVTKSIFAYTDSTSTPSSIHETRYLNSATSTELYSYFDGFNRKIQERKEAEPTNTYAVKDYIYSGVGLVKQESLPYFASSTSYSVATTTNTLYTFSNNFTDQFFRPLTVANAVGTTTYTYDDWKTTVTDPNGKSKDYYKDAYDNLVTVVEPLGTTTATTTYTWDLNKNLTKITDALGNIRNFTYDGMGRRITAEDLHTPADTYFGTWTYAYDDAGNATSTVDAKSQRVNRTFDALNRPLTEDYTGLTGTEITYKYDTCNDGVLRLCGATSTAASTNLVYNPLGQVKTETKTIAGTNYVTKYDYDRLGNVASTTYPDSMQVINTYNDAGLLNRVGYRESNTNTLSMIVAQTNYTPLEQVRYRLFGNNASTTNTYDDTKVYRLTRKVTSGVSTSTPGGGGAFLMGGGGEGGEELSFVLPIDKKLAKSIEQYSLAFADLSDKEEAIDAQIDTSISSDLLLLPEIESVASTTSDQVATTTDSTVIQDTTELTATSSPVGSVVLATSTPLEATTTVSSSTKPVATSSPFMYMLAEKPVEERADIKGQEIAKVQSLPRTSRGGYDIEIVRVEPIKGGVQAFVRAWRKDGTQVGFGTDGSVDMERFRIFNPPILVLDATGPIVETWTDQDGSEHSRTLREDPKEALLQVIEHNLSVMQNIHGPEKIVREKIGRTTTTFYPAAGANSPVDGYTALNYNYGSGSETNFNTLVTRDDASYAPVNGVAGNLAGFYGGQNNWGDLYRGFFLFDTSVIGSDTISSATISIYGYGKNDGGTPATPDINIYSSNPASTNNLVGGDHDQIGTTTMSSTISYGSWTTAAYNNFALNAAGLSNINKAGISKFGTANVNYDTANRISSSAADPTYEQNIAHNLQGYFVDQTGTTQDPALIVETTSPSSGGTSIQDFSYTYDANGNITQIVDNSTTNTNGTYTYTYDDLNRLTQAVLNATTKSYTYNAIGNISSSTDMGPYTYAGDTSTYYANPHTPTSINGSSYTYDNDGNLLTGGGLTNEWDYRNRLGTTTHSSLTETYGYDESNNRVYYKTGTTTTYYPNSLYSILGATSTKYVMANGEPVARIVGSNASSTIFYVHDDHLGGVHVLSDSNAVEAEAINYYPFGAIKIDDKVTANSPKKYINQYLDPTTNLSYLNARFYQNTQGQFLSEDPVFLAIGSPLAEQLSKQKLQIILSNPQKLNSYSYAENNPISIKDPSGLIGTPTAVALGIYAQIINLLSQAVVLLGGGGSVNPRAASTAMFAHSTTINPQSVNITSSNQQYYGNIINQIKKSDDFNNYLKKQIKDNAKEGEINVSADGAHSLNFNTGDLKTSLHAANAGLVGKEKSDGSWNIQVNIQDTYNFEPNNYGSTYSSRAVSTINNAAVLGQWTGIVTPYSVNINFDYTYTSQ